MLTNCTWAKEQNHNFHNPINVISSAKRAKPYTITTFTTPPPMTTRSLYIPLYPYILGLAQVSTFSTFFNWDNKPPWNADLQQSALKSRLLAFPTVSATCRTRFSRSQLPTNENSNCNTYCKRKFDKAVFTSRPQVKPGTCCTAPVFTSFNLWPSWNHPSPILEI